MSFLQFNLVESGIKHFLWFLAPDRMSKIYLKKAKKKKRKKNWEYGYLRVCPRENWTVVLHAISPISMKLCQFKGSALKLRQSGLCFGFFPGGDRPPPPVFLGFHQGNRFKIGKMYEALTAMVFNQLLWGFAHIFTSLVDVRCKYQSIWLTACQSTEANIRLCF